MPKTKDGGYNLDDSKLNPFKPEAKKKSTSKNSTKKNKPKK